MTTYHKIHSPWKRDPDTHKFIFKEWSRPEFGYLAHLKWIWREKIDGTNIRLMWDCTSQTFSIGGRTDNAQIPVPLYNHLTSLVERITPMFLDKYERDVTLYGEGVGPKIQKGAPPYFTDDKGHSVPGFILFDVNIGGVFLEPDIVDAIALGLEIPVAPQWDICSIYDSTKDCEEGVRSVAAPGHIAEGLVGTPSVRLLDHRGDRIITKIKTKDFQ